eukprot:GHVS01077035.1.p1 GENE.GHVS01077035.1~~GHVS01077035.1.p1  ORF type:complete len:385 (-),score=96.24 GHVS01077035.1:1902-3056(-)
MCLLILSKPFDWDASTLSAHLLSQSSIDQTDWVVDVQASRGSSFGVVGCVNNAVRDAVAIRRAMPLPDEGCADVNRGNGLDGFIELLPVTKLTNWPYVQEHFSKPPSSGFLAASSSSLLHDQLPTMAQEPNGPQEASLDPLAQAAWRYRQQRCAALVAAEQTFLSDTTTTTSTSHGDAATTAAAAGTSDNSAGSTTAGDAPTSDETIPYTTTATTTTISATNCLSTAGDGCGANSSDGSSISSTCATSMLRKGEVAHVEKEEGVCRSDGDVCWAPKESMGAGGDVAGVSEARQQEKTESRSLMNSLDISGDISTDRHDDIHQQGAEVSKQKRSQTNERDDAATILMLKKKNLRLEVELEAVNQRYNSLRDRFLGADKPGGNSNT